MTLGVGGTGFRVTYDTYGLVTAAVANLQFGSNAFTAAGSSHCNGLAGTYYQGMIDEFQIYSKELSAADIRRLMLNYSPGEH